MELSLCASFTVATEVKEITSKATYWQPGELHMFLREIEKACTGKGGSKTESSVQVTKVQNTAKWPKQQRYNVLPS